MRPAPLIVVSLLILCLLAIPVSAETIIFEDANFYDTEWTSSWPGGQSDMYQGGTIDAIGFGNIQDYHYLKTVVYSWTHKVQLTDSSKGFAKVRVTLVDQTTEEAVVSGYLTYSIVEEPYRVYVILDLDNPFGFIPYSGTKTFRLDYDKADFNNFRFSDSTTTWPQIKNTGWIAWRNPVGFTPSLTSATLYPGQYEFYFISSFKNVLEYSPKSPSGYDINLIRNIDGNTYPSTVTIRTGDKTIYNNYEINDITLSTYEPEFTVDVLTTYGKTFTHSVSATPGDDVSGPFSLALSRSSAQIGETLTATLTVQDDAPHYSYLVWSCTPDDHPDMATWSYRIQDENGTWYERAANGDEIPISAADALTYQATPAYPGGHHIGVTIYDHHPPCQGLEQRATLAKSFEAVHKPSSSPVRIQVVDERTGALIAGSNIQVIDSQLPPFEGTGINPIIDTTLPQGSEMFYLQRNAYDEPRYRIFADADGYRQVTENQWFSVNPPAPNTVTTVTVQMAATVAPPEDPNNAFVTFRIRDEDGNPVREARVTLDRWTRHALGTRPVTFEVPRGATYQYTVEPIDPGLYPATGSVTVGAEDSYEVNVVLSRTPGDDPGATPPPRDTRTNEEKGKAVIDLLADNAELIATLAILAAVMGLINLIMPGRRRR